MTTAAAHQQLDKTVEELAGQVFDNRFRPVLDFAAAVAPGTAATIADAISPNRDQYIMKHLVAVRELQQEGTVESLTKALEHVAELRRTLEKESVLGPAETIMYEPS
jgi:hypothetical protein